MALYKLEACRKSRWFLKPHATEISGHKILNGNLQSAQKCLHPKKHTNTLSINASTWAVPTPSVPSTHLPLLKTSISSTWTIFHMPPKKNWATFFFAARSWSCIFYYPNMCVCVCGRIRRGRRRWGRKASLSVCARDVRESRACITSVSCNLFSSFLSFSFYLSPPA